MGSDEVARSYLRSKFSSSLREAEAEADLSKDIKSLFQTIEELIRNKTTTQDELYNLINALSDCTHQRRYSKKSSYVFRAFLFEKRMRGLLLQIQGNLRERAPEPSKRVDLPDLPNPALIKGFESQVKEIEKLITPKEFKAIGIVGRCGCGKTALAQQVFTSREIENDFFPRIWVPLSQFLLDHKPPDLRVKILNYILREIGIGQGEIEGQDGGDYSVVKLLERLQLGLMGRRYLIVLDDLFADLAGQPTAESLSHGLPKGSGGAVMVTSRSESVMRKMVREKYAIQPVSDEICWDIFNQAGKDKLDYESIDGMKDTVVKNCDGLPRAAIALANLPKLLNRNSNTIDQ